MEEFHTNNTSQDESFYYDYYSSDITYLDHNEPPWEVDPRDVVTCIIIAVGLLLTLTAICAVCSLVRKDHVVPIYVINLLISDLIQYCQMILLVVESHHRLAYKIRQIFDYIYFSSLIVSVCFMVCIALERYLVIACPLWYRFRHTIKFSVVLCVMIWILCPVSVLTLWVLWNSFISPIIVGTFLLLPLPLFIFFLGGTIRALSASRVPSDEKRRIVGMLVLVLLIYTLLFLPAIFLCMAAMRFPYFPYMVFVFLMFSPLADAFLYVFMRKGSIDKLLASVCCCGMDSNDSSRMDSSDITSSVIV